MKYIRTEYEIFEFDKMIVPPRTSKSIFSRIIVGANTIEELCDEFVSIFKDNDKFVETDFQMAQDRFTGLKGIRKPIACYGAIWTDKGLQFVARMNSKGVLELL